MPFCVAIIGTKKINLCFIGVRNLNHMTLDAKSGSPPLCGHVHRGLCHIYSSVESHEEAPLTNLMKSIPPEVQERIFTHQQLNMIADQLLEWPHKAVGLGLSESEIEDIKEDHKNSKKLP